MGFWKNLATSKAWTCWLEYVKRRNFHKSVVTRWTQIHMGKAFRGWVHYLETRKRCKVILTRAIRKMKLKSLYEAWDGWLDFIEHKKWMKLSCTKTAMEEEVRVLVHLWSQQLSRTSTGSLSVSRCLTSCLGNRWCA